MHEALADGSAPGISAIIPAYNYAHYLSLAIESVLQQGYPLFELIVVDDGSTDNTAEVVAHYGEAVRYVYQKNAGLSAARNTGIQTARFDYVAFLDADDQWLPTFLKVAMNRFAQLPADFALVACRARSVDAKGAPLNIKLLTSEQPEEITRADILMKTQFAPSSVVVKRAVFTECGNFDTTLRSSEDRDMWIRIAARRRIFRNSERLVLFRRHPGSMSTHADRMKQNIRHVLAKARRDPQVACKNPFFWLQVFSFFHFQTAWMYYLENRRGTAVRDLLFSLLLWPCFGNLRRLNVSPFFRVRSLLHFLSWHRATTLGRD